MFITGAFVYVTLSTPNCFWHNNCWVWLMKVEIWSPLGLLQSFLPGFAQFDSVLEEAVPQNCNHNKFTKWKFCGVCKNTNLLVWRSLWKKGQLGIWVSSCMCHNQFVKHKNLLFLPFCAEMIKSYLILTHL